jgi:hypothetical protein
VLIQFRQDRTRLFWECHPRGFPARRVEDFLKWIDKNFEVRWLTAWAIWGTMNPDSHERLCAILDCDVPKTWDNPMPWANPIIEHSVELLDIGKVRGIDLTERRPWFWLDDEEFERQFLPEEHRHRLLQTDSSEDRNALIVAAMKLSELVPETTFPQFTTGI